MRSLFHKLSNAGNSVHYVTRLTPSMILPESLTGFSVPNRLTTEHLPLFVSPGSARALPLYALFSADREFFQSLQNFSMIFQKSRM